MFGTAWGTILSLLSNVFGFFKKIADIFQSEQQKQAGRDEANAETLRKEAELVAEAKQIEVEAEKDHAGHTEGDEGLDTSFRRD